MGTRGEATGDVVPDRSPWPRHSARREWTAHGNSGNISRRAAATLPASPLLPTAPSTLNPAPALHRSLVLALDFGTQSVRAVLIDAEGPTVARAQ